MRIILNVSMHSNAMAMLGDVGLIHVLPLAVHLFFWAEQVEGVSLSHFYSLGLLLETSFMLKSYWLVGGILVAQNIHIR